MCPFGTGRCDWTYLDRRLEIALCLALDRPDEFSLQSVRCAEEARKNNNNVREDKHSTHTTHRTTTTTTTTTHRSAPCVSLIFFGQTQNTSGHSTHNTVVCGQQKHRRGRRPLHRITSTPPFCVIAYAIGSINAQRGERCVCTCVFPHKQHQTLRTLRDAKRRWGGDSQVGVPASKMLFVYIGCGRCRFHEFRMQWSLASSLWLWWWLSLARNSGNVWVVL